MPQNDNGAPPKVQGTYVRVRKSLVVDGDTVRAYPPNSEKAESLRILSLDTEESFKFGSKPSTPWGKAAKDYAKQFFSDQDEIIIEFPGNESVEECLVKYRGAFGRLLVWIHRLDGVEYSEHMIRLGYSPYYNKYGNAEFEAHHRRFMLAERDAQMIAIGVWDQQRVNGRVIRDYAKLCTWWSLRAGIIDRYRANRKSGVVVYNTRKDFQKLREEAEKRTSVTIFTEIRDVRRSSSEEGNVSATASIGTDDRPVQIYVPDADSKVGEQILELFRTRYIGTEYSPRRGYCYLRGELTTAGNGVRMTVERTFDVMDELWMADEMYAVSTVVQQVETRQESNGSKRRKTDTKDSAENPSEKKRRVTSGAGRVRISKLLPNPVGIDRGNETVTLVATGGEVNLRGWLLRTKSGARSSLEGSVTQEGKTINLSGNLRLANTGGTVMLIDAAGVEVHEVSYNKADATEGAEIRFN
ncbi:unnamed protein product [Chondrus crispus]|uniref:TNase-like domain-containing protein n=1 Tax=Chondrus crispus TaxID=2769 RepID=R7QIY4_CHOCR|nr:unnamed protein product [Chondrus crispus]CDF38467.1 unnamed protein product [Chondrus crispus]|eukprot:XP_005718360.1 unnamed protein product [Chondrus crispus]